VAAGCVAAARANGYEWQCGVFGQAQVPVVAVHSFALQCRGCLGGCGVRGGAWCVLAALSMYCSPGLLSAQVTRLL
jgi:hypothetical protein